MIPIFATLAPPPHFSQSRPAENSACHPNRSRCDPAPFASQLTASAWSRGGHKLTAAIAFRSLSETNQASAIRILSAHPSFGTWRKEYQNQSTPRLERPIWLFMRASLWADEIRLNKHPDRAHRQTTWHFINYPLRPPNFPDDPPRDGDLLTAIKSSLETIRDPEAPAVEKAISLAWLIHLVGDLHQPLHTTTLINDNYPAGDRGGNDFYIRPNVAPVSLHDFWDDLLGTSATFRTPHHNAIRLVTAIPRAKCPELKKSTTIEAWTRESRFLAINYAYRNLDLTLGTQTNPAPITEEYRKRAKRVAERQAVLAGYRLADLLSKDLP